MFQYQTREPVFQRTLLEGLLHCQKCLSPMVAVDQFSARPALYACPLANGDNRKRVRCATSPLPIGILDSVVVVRALGELVADSGLRELVRRVHQELIVQGTTDDSGHVDDLLEDADGRTTLLHAMFEAERREDLQALRAFLDLVVERVLVSPPTMVMEYRSAGGSDDPD